MPFIRIDELDLRANTPRYASLVHAILGVMLFPEDQSGLDTFRASALSSQASEVNRALGFRAIRIDVDIYRPDIELRDPVKMVKEAVPYVVTGRAEHPTAPRLSGVTIAAEILKEALTLSRADTTGRGVTLKTCLANVSTWLNSMKSAKGAHPDDLKEQWHKYRRSAPIALAFANLMDVFHDQKFMDDPRNVVTLCALANSYLVEGEGIRHRNAEHPILPRGECWELLIRPRADLRRTLPQKIP